MNHTSFQTHPGWVPAGPGTHTGWGERGAVRPALGKKVFTPHGACFTPKSLSAARLSGARSAAGERAWGRLKVACHPDWCSHDGHPSCERARREKGPLPSRARHQTPTCAALVVASDDPRPDAALAGEVFGLLFRGVRVVIAQGHRGVTPGHREALLSRTPVLFCSSDALRAHGQTLICTLRRLQDRRRPWRRSWAAGHASLMPPSR